MSRKLIIAGNWKMNHTSAQTRSVIEALKPKVADLDGVDIVVCAPFTSLPAAADAVTGSNIAVGAQNVHWEANGAYTGEISAAMLCEIPVKYAVVGHSERRQYFGETNESVNRRARAALDANLIPIVCVGETLEQRDAGLTESVVEEHVRIGLSGFSVDDMLKVVIAYEPVWAIGTGVTATPEQAQQVHAHIRALLRDMFGDRIADAGRIQYGGSVKPDNSEELMSQQDVDGALVGGASLDPDVFSQLIHNAVAE